MALMRKKCPQCGAEISVLRADKCPRCGEGLNQPWYASIWFWAIVGIGLLMLGGMLSIMDSAADKGAQETDSGHTQAESVEYEPVELQHLFDVLDTNAAYARELYQDRYVQLEGRIVMLDGDGTYVRVKAADAEAWNAPTVLCYVTDREQGKFLELASKGDPVTVRGRITSVGRMKGYTLMLSDIE